MEKGNERKEIRVEARIRNNILWHAIFDKYSSVAEFCRHSGTQPSMVGDYLNLKLSPYYARRKNRFISKQAEKIADFLGMHVLALFPERLYEVRRTNVVVEIPFTALPNLREVLQLPASQTPYDNIIAEELKDAIRDSLKLFLTEREEWAVREYFGLDGGEPKTFKQISAELGVTIQAVQGMVGRSLQYLKDHVHCWKPGGRAPLTDYENYSKP